MIKVNKQETSCMIMKVTIEAYFLHNKIQKVLLVFAL